jgi:hypothetical protein
VDGSLKYPYPVEEVIYFLAETADLILTFFDPMGQALCKRTMTVVEKLYSFNKQINNTKQTASFLPQAFFFLVLICFIFDVFFVSGVRCIRTKYATIFQRQMR